MSFSYSASGTSQADIKRGLDDKHKERGRELKDAAQADPTVDPAAAGVLAGRTAEDLTGELDDLHAAAVKMAEAGVRGLNGKQYQVSVSGHRDTTQDAVSVSVSAFR